MDTAKTMAQGAIYAADCVEDHVFTIDSSARFCVAPLDDLENQTYIETLSLPSNAQTASCTSCARRTACTPSTRLWAHWRWSAPSRCPPA